MRNPFVDQAIEQLRLAQPDIEVPARQYYAQCAEDLIVVSLLKALADREGLALWQESYLEVGANHPVATNATYLLNIELGMVGVLVEANPKLVPDLQRARPRDVIVNKAIHASDAPTVELFVSNQNELTSLSRDFVETWRNGAVGLNTIVTVEACRMNTLLEEYFSRKAPIYLSVDVEGLDLQLLQDVDWNRWRPALVQAEPSEHFIKDNALQIAEFMRSIDYVLISRTDVNQIFVDRHRISTEAPVVAPPHRRRRSWLASLKRQLFG